MTYDLRNSPEKPVSVSLPEVLVLFDGCCRLCNRFVDFLIRRDRRGRLRYAPLQGQTARKYVQQPEARIIGMDSVILVEQDRISLKSSAALRAFKYLPVPWKLACVLLVLPRFVRDWGYDRLARNRYRLFGKLDTCRAPSPGEEYLFLP